MNPLRVEEGEMETHRRTAAIVGVLFIVGTVAASLSIVFTGPILEDPDYLTRVSANENQIIIGALLVLTMGLALAIVPVMMFPVLKRHSESLAMGYVVFRGGLETVTTLAFVTSLLLLIPLSRAYVGEAPDASGLATLGTLLLETDFQTSSIIKIVFSLGALMLYAILYRWKLIPRWLSGWGLVGAALHLASGLLVSFGWLAAYPILGLVWDLPIALQEMVMALWLIARGFSPAAISAGSARQR
jgi:hypothetical protein